MVRHLLQRHGDPRYLATSKRANALDSLARIRRQSRGTGAVAPLTTQDRQARQSGCITPNDITSMKGHDMTGTDPLEQPTQRPDPQRHRGTRTGEPQDQGMSTSRAGIPMPSAAPVAGSGVGGWRAAATARCSSTAPNLVRGWATGWVG